jgi:hypothetical protein
MRIVWKSTLYLLFTVIASLGPSYQGTAFAQDSCSPIIDQLRSAIASCSRINSNSACYGNAPAFVSPLDVDFDAPGEQQLVTALEVIETSPDAGAVLMLLHLAGTESPIKVILFGGSELTQQSAAGNIFTMQGGAGGELCPQSPSGMVVRTESGEQGILTVNGVEIQLGSAAYIAMTDDDSMVIANLEGEVTVTIDGQSQEIPVGYESQIIQIGIGQPVFAGPPVPSSLYGSPVGQWLATGTDGLPLVQASEPDAESTSTLPVCAGNITFGETVTAEIPTADGECLYTFCSEEGREVSINLEGIDATLDPWVGLRGPEDTLLKYNNDISEQNLNSRICNSTLPVLGCYTIVVRSNNDNAGLFRLSLNQQTTCALPVPRCEVVALGLNQREGPGLDSPVIRTLPQGTQLRPLESSADGQWARVLVAGTSLEGWVNISALYLACEGPVPAPVIPASPTQPVPGETSEPPPPPPPSKVGPFGEP